MSGFKLPPAAGISALSTVERAAILDALFEPCTELHNLSLDLLHTETFQSYNALIASVGAQLTDLSESLSKIDMIWLDKILGAHPRLGPRESNVDRTQSRAEQAHLNDDGDQQGLKLQHLNAEYEKTFDGLKYVVFVNGKSRTVIMKDMVSRIKRGDIERERADAIKALCDIAVDRAIKLQQS